MKTLLNFKLLFFACLLLFVTECSTDRVSVQPMKMISSANQLASDTSFVALVQLNKKIVNTLFAKMRSLGGKAARERQSLEISRLINSSNTTDNANALANQFGFANRTEFVNSILESLKRNAELRSRYSNFGVDFSKFKTEAYSIASANFVSSKQVAGRTTEVCVLCPFNNCSECFGNEDGGCMSCLEQPNDNGGSGGGATTCKAACANARVNARNLAELEAFGELVAACGTAFTSVQDYLIAREQYQNAPLGGGLAFIACGAFTYARYINNINLAENNYVTCVNGCK